MSDLTKNKTQPRKFKVSLAEKDSNHLKQISELLGISESEVMRKGLQLMALYAKTRQDESTESALILKEGDKNRELVIL